MELFSPQEIFKDGIDGTMISQWPCKRKFYNRFVRGLDTPELSTAIRFGKAADVVLERYFRKEISSLAEMSKLFESLYEDRGDDNRRTVERGVTILKIYLRTFPRDFEPFDIIAIQEPFKIDVGAKVPFCGKPDLIIKDRDSGLFLPLDNKTTTSYGDSFSDKFEIDTSTQGYVYYVGKKYGKCYSARFNVLVPQVTKPRVERFDVSYSDEQIEFWKRRTQRMINEIVSFVEENWRDADAFTLADSRCTDFNSRCQYWDLCKYGDKTELIKGDFVRRSWSPFRVD